MTDFIEKSFFAKTHAFVMVFEKVMSKVFEKETHISLSQFFVLAVIHHIPQTSQKQISEIRNLTEAAISRQVELLEKGGFITRIKKVGNKREHVLALTEKGEQEYTHDMNLVDKHVGDTFSFLTKKEEALLSKIFNTALWRVMEKGTHEGLTCPFKKE
ncbi:MAG: MarR family transcriptional regulator [Candidatus Paceibacterota bacterium]|jgi:DNA-binding MarR family transcriptional regulator